MYNKNIAIIDNTASTLYGLCLVERPKIPTPERDVEVHDIRGRETGGIYQYYGYKDITITLNFNFLEAPSGEADFKALFYAIRSWLLNGKQLSFSDEVETYYKIKHVTIEEAVNDIVEYGEFSVNFVLSPFGYIIENPVPLDGSSQVLIEGFYNALPVFYFTPTNTDTTLTIDGTSLQFTGLQLGSSYVLDCERQLLLRLSPDTVGSGTHEVDETYKMSVPNFPSLTVGVHTININTSNASMYRNLRR